MYNKICKINGKGKTILKERKREGKVEKERSCSRRRRRRRNRRRRRRRRKPADRGE